MIFGFDRHENIVGKGENAFNLVISKSLSFSKGLNELSRWQGTNDDSNGFSLSSPQDIFNSFLHIV